MIFKRHRHRIFCIGLNKTGTTSLGTFLEDVGFEVAKQRKGEALLPDYINRDFNSIIKYCKDSKADVFQDVPFSLPFTFAHLDNAFPDSRFILTQRNDPEQWYNSILKFHSDVFNNGQRPTYESLVKSKYIYEGWAWELMKDVFIRSKEEMYEKSHFMDVYRNHIREIESYFKNKSHKLISINLTVKDDFQRLCEFLNIQTELTEFPRITSKDIATQNFSSRFLKQ